MGDARRRGRPRVDALSYEEAVQAADRMCVFIRESSGTLVVIFPEYTHGRPCAPWHAEVFAWIDACREAGDAAVQPACDKAYEHFGLLARENIAAETVMKAYRLYAEDRIPMRVIDAANDGEAIEAARELMLCGPDFQRSVRERFLSI
jgi:hypothetical protein